MSSQCTCYINPSQNIVDIHGRLKRHVIIYPPPYSIEHILQPYVQSIGKQITVVIHHASRDVHVTEPSVSRHVLQTAVRSFQSHRLRPPVYNPFALEQRFQPNLNTRCASQPTKKDCPICFEPLGTCNAFALPCAHSFHPHCIQPWVMQNNTCPVCRHPI